MVDWDGFGLQIEKLAKGGEKEKEIKEDKGERGSKEQEGERESVAVSKSC